MGVLTRNKKQEKRNSDAKSFFVKIVRPGGQVELFRDPIPAGEIMSRYPRHCVTRSDFFDYPWVVVRPESVLMPGKVFFLVPHHTVDKVTKEKMHHFQQSLDRPPYLPAEPAHHSRGSAPAGQHHDHKKPITEHHLNHRRGHYNYNRSNQHEDRHRSNNITSDQDSDSGGLYKEMFYESWEEMRRRLEQLQQDREDSPLENRRPSRELALVQKPKSCLREAGSGRKELDLKVTFSCPIVIPGSQRGTPVHQGENLH